MEINLLSKYRAALMGVAMLFIAVFHSTLTIDNIIGLRFIKFAGDIGVDIFFFVSGIGMFYSFLKTTDIKSFYRKRLIRILPAWVVLNLVVQLYDAIFNGFNPGWFVLNMTGLSFWLTGSLYYWYVPAILVLYLVTPFFMKMFEKNIKKAYAFLAIAWIVCIGLCFVVHNAHFFIILFRVPVYFTGIYAGKLCYDKTKVDGKWTVITALLFFISLVPEIIIMKYNETVSFIRYDFKYLCFFVTVVTGTILLAHIFAKCNMEKGVVVRCLSYIGGCTLEIYLLHEFVLARCTYWLSIAGVNTASALILNVINIVVFVAVVFMAHGLEKVFAKVK